MKFLFTWVLVMFSLLSFSQRSEEWVAQVNYQSSGHLGFSIQKDFIEVEEFVFGPRIEFVTFVSDSSSLFNFYPVCVWYNLNPNVSVGVAPLWMKGSLPQNLGYYTPSSVAIKVKVDHIGIEVWGNFYDPIRPFHIRVSHDLTFLY